MDRLAPRVPKVRWGTEERRYPRGHLGPSELLANQGHKVTLAHRGRKVPRVRRAARVLPARVARWVPQANRVPLVSLDLRDRPGRKRHRWLGLEGFRGRRVNSGLKASVARRDRRDLEECRAKSARCHRGD